MPVGVRIVDDPTPAGDGMPVMDVPVFVGFATRGPRDRPVALDSAADFEAVFGGLLDLVQGGTGEDPADRVVAHLQPAVTAFFAGGGRRCHVIRVAGAMAASASFAVPGLHLATLAAGVWTVEPAEFQLRASSPGAWADRLELASRLNTQALHAGDGVARGDLLRASQPGSTQIGWACVWESGLLTDVLNPPPPPAEPRRALAWRWAEADTPAVDASSWLIERVQLDLAVRAPATAPSRLDACDLAAGAARLPWFGPDADAAYDVAQAASDSPLAAQAASGWPLAGQAAEPVDDWMLLPLGVTDDFDRWQPAMLDGRDALEREGLASFEASLFVDPDWRDGLRGPLLMNWADDIRFLGPAPRRLRGLHGALGRDDACAAEGSWVLVPDAVHPGWRRSTPLPSRDIAVTTTPDPACTCPPTTFDDCAPPPPVPPQPPRVSFAPAAATLPAVLPADTPFTLSLQVDPADGGGPQRLEVQVAGQPDFSDARSVADATPAISLPLSLPLSLGAGAWWLRARAHRAGLASCWSEVIELDVRATGWRALAATDAAVIDTVQSALLALCAASREHFALLSLPADWREATVAGHVAALRAEGQKVDRDSASTAASFAALHHPWLLQRDADDRLRPHPPAGAVMGLLSRRSRSHGAWGAPGADPLPAALALSGELQSPDAIEALGANPLALRADGIAAVRSQTLSLDADWTAIGVRRLFILLRRLCRREGQRFVFEPNDLTLRRGLERSFDALLHRLMQRGAFRGGDAASSYLLKTASGAEAAREIERGECSLLIQVAPSRPLRFLTLHLRRSGEQLLIEER
jgi:hypothetical protein